MHAHLSLLLASAAAFAPSQTLYNLHKLPALFAETAEPDPALAAAIDAAVALCAKEGAPTAAEDRRLDFAGSAARRRCEPISQPWPRPSATRTRRCES